MDSREHGIYMVLVIGGSFQGKLAYVKRELEKQGILISEQDIVDGEFFDVGKSGRHIRVLNRLHRMVWRSMKENALMDAEAVFEICKRQLEPLLAASLQVVVICDEVGYGVIPLEKEQRVYREAVGRVLCYLAQHSEKMERIVGGFPIRIK